MKKAKGRTRHAALHRVCFGSGGRIYPSAHILFCFRSIKVVFEYRFQVCIYIHLVSRSNMYVYVYIYHISNKALALEDRVSCIRSKQEGSCTLSAPLEQRTKFTGCIWSSLASLQECYTTPETNQQILRAVRAVRAVRARRPVYLEKTELCQNLVSSRILQVILQKKALKLEHCRCLLSYMQLYFNTLTKVNFSNVQSLEIVVSEQRKTRAFQNIPKNVWSLTILTV